MIVRTASLIKATNRQRDEHKTEGRSQVMKATVPLRGMLRSAPWLCSVPGYRHHPGALCCSSSRHLLPKPAARQVWCAWAHPLCVPLFPGWESEPFLAACSQLLSRVCRTIGSPSGGKSSPRCAATAAGPAGFGGCLG